jgi:hypothetical protein
LVLRDSLKLSTLASALVAILVLNTISIEAVAGQTDAAKTNKKQDIFKVLLTVDGINHAWHILNLL